MAQKHVDPVPGSGYGSGTLEKTIAGTDFPNPVHLPRSQLKQTRNREGLGKKISSLYEPKRGTFLIFLYDIQQGFICRPSDSTVPQDAGIEPRTVATTALAVRSSNHSAKSHPHAAKSHPHSAKSHPHSAKSHPFFLLTLGLEAPAPQQRYRRFSREKKQSLQLTTIFRQNSGLRRC